MAINEPAAIAHVAIHETVERMLSSRDNGRLLDVPTGEGALAKRLLALGIDVTCADLYPEIFKLAGFTADKADLDGQLPYEDGVFDTAVCIEGLEHVENPANAIREFARIIRPGGTLIISVPNILNIEERLKWLFTGYTSHFKPLSADVLSEIRSEFAGIEEVALHVNPIGYSEVRYLLEKSGFELIRVLPDASKSRLWVFRPIVWAIHLASRFTSTSKRRARWTDELNSDEVLLGGNTLIFEARRKEQKR